MHIKGFVKVTEDEAVLANVHIVSDIRKSGGKYFGYMELADSDEIVIVKKHESGCYNGQIVKEI